MSAHPDKITCQRIHFVYRSVGGNDGYVTNATINLDYSMTIVEVREMFQSDGGWLIGQTWYPSNRILSVSFSE